MSFIFAIERDERERVGFVEFLPAQWASKDFFM